MKAVVKIPCLCGGWQRPEFGVRAALAVTLLGGVFFGAGTAAGADSERTTLTFALDSLPSGAEVRYTGSDGERAIGRTPLTLDVPMESERPGRRFNPFRKKAWRPAPDAERPIGIRREEDNLFFDFSGLTMHRQGYAPEHLSGGWTIASDLRQREGRWKSVPVTNRYEATIVFKTPVEPQTTNAIEIVSVPPGATLHAFDAQGGIGEAVGQTPVVFTLGFAPLRSDAGAITNWVRWHGETGALWAHTADGMMLLNAVLVLDGYEPQPVVGRPLFQVHPEASMTYRSEIPMLGPARPTAKFKLEVDSLPAGATIYALRPDGSLANKLGETPLTFEIGLAQELAEQADGRVVHADWRVWDPHGVLAWQNGPEGAAAFTLVCALHKEGYALERVQQRVFAVAPGRPIPKGTTVTVPLSPARGADGKDSVSARGAAPDKEGVGKPIIWQSPEQSRASPKEPEQEADPPARPEKKSFLDRFRP